MSAFEICPSRKQDCGIIRDLIFELARYERLEHECQATPELLEKELFGPSPVIRCVLLWETDDDGRREAVGFALYFFNFSTFVSRRGLYLEDLYVTAKARGKGYGRALMQYLAQTAVNEGCGRFDWVVLDWNQPAIDFYEHIGATVMPDWRICRLQGQALLNAAKR